MKGFSEFRKRNAREGAPLTSVTWACVLVLLLAFAAISANAQLTINQPTTTTLWGGTQDFNIFGLADLTAPASGVILQGTAISAITGKPVRHMWYGDSSNGLCRVDPEVDDPGVNSGPGLGSHHNIIQTCIGFIQAAGFKPGQIAFDPTTNTLYAPNVSTTSNSIVRFHYVPSGDNGQGLVDPVHVEVLMGAQAGRNGAGGCPLVGDPLKNGAVGTQPDATSLGPDGNLYLGYKRGGLVLRFLHPATFDPANPIDCQTAIQVPLFSADERLGNGHTFALAWIGHELFGGDNISPWIIPNADRCLTPANGNNRCKNATEILGTFIPQPQSAISDQSYPATTGNTLYFGTISQVTRITGVQALTSMKLAPNYGSPATGFAFITGLTLDASDPALHTLYVGDDPTQGLINGAARIWKVVPQAPPPGPPLAPVNVSATAGDTAATVSWLPNSNGQPITNYLIHTSFASNGVTVPDITVNPAPGTTVLPTSFNVTGLTNGVTYMFELAAINTNGTSSFSLPSNAVTPFPISVPGAPTAVSAVASDTVASVAWSAPASNGGSAITSYTVTALVGGAPVGITATVPASSTGTVMTGLTDGTTYTFTVHATNVKGNSAESVPSNAVTPSVASSPPDLAISMQGPTSVNSNSNNAYTMTIVNGGPGTVAQVILTDSIPTTGATFVSEFNSQGTCLIAGSTFTCNLGALAPGGTATVTITLNIISAGTNTATVKGNDALGNPLPDANPANNTASITTTIAAATGGGSGSTDIQVVGSAQNGGPTAPASDTITWQVKNATSNTTASNVSFTSSTSSTNMTFTSVSASQGSCSLTGTQSLSCTDPTLSGGQTMVVTVTVNISVAGTAIATGSASFGGTDTQPSNNTNSVTIGAR